MPTKAIMCLTLGLSLALATCSATAITLADDAIVRAQIERDSDGFRACGIHATVMMIQLDQITAYDFSIMVSSTLPYGTLKAGKHVGPMANVLKNKALPKATVPGPKNYWFALESDDKPLWPVKTMQGDDAGYLLALGDVALSYKMILAMANGEASQFAIRYASEPADAVVSFAKPMNDKERSALIICLDSVINKLVKSNGG